MSDTSNTAEFQLQLIKEFINVLVKQPPFNDPNMDSLDQDFLEQFVRLAKAMEAQEADFHFLGQDLVTRLIRNYARLAPLLDRELLWFFGGDCLHYMPDEEIAMYQTLDDLTYEAAANNTTFDRKEARNLLLKKSAGTTKS